MLLFDYSTDLHRLRERLITAREEERRLRRDLHDGLGPTRAALNLRAGTLRALMTRDPAAADAQVAEIRLWMVQKSDAASAPS